MAWKVVLQVFSGRPDPRWPLTQAQAAELARRLAALPRMAPGGKAAEPPDLGYRGFVVEPEGAADLPGPVHVYRGFVLLPAGRRLDPGRATERWLLDSGGAAVEPAVHDYVLHELEGQV